MCLGPEQTRLLALGRLPPAYPTPHTLVTYVFSLAVGRRAPPRRNAPKPPTPTHTSRCRRRGPSACQRPHRPIRARALQRRNVTQVVKRWLGPGKKADGKLNHFRTGSGYVIFAIVTAAVRTAERQAMQGNAFAVCGALGPRLDSLQSVGASGIFQCRVKQDSSSSTSKSTHKRGQRRSSPSAARPQFDLSAAHQSHRPHSLMNPFRCPSVPRHAPPKCAKCEPDSSFQRSSSLQACRVLLSLSSLPFLTPPPATSSCRRRRRRRRPADAPRSRHGTCGCSGAL